MEKIWAWPRPSWFGYSFVGFAGMTKMSSSKGGVPTAQDALEILEAPIVRWLYVRRRPQQAFNIDFGPEVVRLYDEWDALARKAADPSKRDAHVLAYERAAATSSSGTLPTPDVVVPFRVLSSVADITAGSADQISRIVADMGHEHDSVDQLQPRLGRAMAWVSEFVPAQERTLVRDEPDLEALSLLTPEQQTWLRLFLDRLGDAHDLDHVTAVVYGVPKLARGLALGDAPTPEVKADQKDFFAVLYRLLVGADRGPRLPTLIVALGADRVRGLLHAA
ncbi:MAG: hypothetical protein R2731_18190 [Nocardioides sp.]